MELDITKDKNIESMHKKSTHLKEVSIFFVALLIYGTILYLTRNTGICDFGFMLLLLLVFTPAFIVQLFFDHMVLAPIIGRFSVIFIELFMLFLIIIG